MPTVSHSHAFSLHMDEREAEALELALLHYTELVAPNDTDFHYILSAISHELTEALNTAASTATTHVHNIHLDSDSPLNADIAEDILRQLNDKMKGM
jgi:hypothetical protein